MAEYFNNLPINEDTQLKIENFLLHYSSILYEKKEQFKNKNSLINYDLISNNFTKLLRDKNIILNDYINNTRQRVYVKKPNRKNELTLYYLNNILKDVDNSYIVSIINGSTSLPIRLIYFCYSSVVTLFNIPIHTCFSYTRYIIVIGSILLL